MSYEEDIRPVNTGLKVGLAVGFIVVWLGLCLLFSKTSTFFREGGWGMWPILAAGMVFLGITIERVKYLFFTVKGSQGDRREFIAQVQKHLMQGDVSGAVAICRASDQPLAKIVGAGLGTLSASDREVH